MSTANRRGVLAGFLSLFTPLPAGTTIEPIDDPYLLEHSNYCRLLRAYHDHVRARIALLDQGVDMPSSKSEWAAYEAASAAMDALRDVQPTTLLGVAVMLRARALQIERSLGMEWAVFPTVPAANAFAAIVGIERLKVFDPPTYP